MHTDNYGHAITTDSSVAADACIRAMHSYCARRSDTMIHLSTALEADPECAFAQALYGLMMCGLRKNSALPMAQNAYDNAKLNLKLVTKREQHYVDALGSAIERAPDRLVDCYEAIVSEHPADLFAIALVQGEAFWTGDMPRSERISASTIDTWDQSMDGYADWLAVRAFDLEECNRLDDAYSCGLQSVKLDPTNVWGAHAVAHVFEMRGNSEEGIAWLDGLKDNWQDAGQLKFHLWWHRCLCHVERGEHDQVLDFHDTWIRNANQPLMQALPDFYLDIQNSASLLLRLELVGVDIGDRWHTLAAVLDDTWLDLTSPFTSLHVGMTLAATGQVDRLNKLVSDIETFSSGPGELARAFRITIPVLKAIGQHRLRHFETVVDLLMPVRSELWEVGGSHAQRDILFQILFDSAKHAGRADLLDSLRQELDRIGFIEPSQRVAYQIA